MNSATASVPNSASKPPDIWLESFSFCPACLTHEFFQPADRERTWMHCSKERRASATIHCPACKRPFEFLGQPQCPFCHGTFADGVALPPYVEPKSAWDRLLKSRGAARDVERQRADSEFAALYASWCQESGGSASTDDFEGTRFWHDFVGVQAQHDQLLGNFAADIEKFLYGAPIRLAKFESEYSWKFDQELGREVEQLLEGILRGKQALPVSLPFLSRYRQRFPRAYSRNYLDAELKRRFLDRRRAPRPGFLLTLDYAKSLLGLEFEEWLARLLREAGIPGVSITQASRDQGADLVVTMGTRKIVMQAKQCQDTIGNSAVQQANGALAYYEATEDWVVATSNFSKDAIDLAYRTGVRLVSGNQLLNLPAMLREGDSNGPEPTVPEDQDPNAPDAEVLAEITPPAELIAGERASAKAFAVETNQDPLQKLVGLSVFGNWKPWQMYTAAGAAMLLVALLVAGLTSERGSRPGSRAIDTQAAGKIQQQRVPRSPQLRPAPKEQPTATVKALPMASAPSESEEQESKLTSYAPGKFSHWYVIDNAQGKITVPNGSYTHVHIVSDAFVRLDMSDCHSVPTVYFDCDSRAGAVTITDLSGTAENHVLIELR